jgi:hypothetical protein
LGDQIIQVEGGRQSLLATKEHKLLKAFPDLTFDSSDACVLPDPATKTLLDIVTTSKTVDCMKVAIIKLYNPLAGKELRSKVL